MLRKMTRPSQQGHAAKLLADNPDQTVAVLARGHSSLAYIARYLHTKHIAVNYDQVLDVRTTRATISYSVLSAMLQAVTHGDKQASNHQLSLLIQHEAFGFSPDALWQLLPKHTNLVTGLKPAQQTTPLRHI